ncbi:germinal-center associated nuclear protein-like isoform X2 [Physella acuta]|uniref:germinal-center associated nuclear protein-like isoform X2 n=1 Tax=Physella acuta TaxID=109671 RepID=UPI0027DD43E9|nr:germinal-center associated nuclear protein-like isoform X2 [Physella acuta]
MQNPLFGGHAVPSTQSGVFGSFGQPSSATQGGTSSFGSFAMQQPIPTAGSFGTSGTQSGQPSFLFGSSATQGGQQSSALNASLGSSTFGSFGTQGGQMSSFSAPHTQAGQSSSTFGSFGTQSTPTFGTQKEQPTPIFGSIGSQGGQSQAVFGSFGASGAQARQSSTFGTHNEQSPSKLGSFGSQGQETSSVFGSFGSQGGQQTSPTFISTNIQDKQSPSIFGGTSGISSGMFRGEHKLGSTFGATTGLSGSNTFGSTTSNSLFGTFTGQASVSVSQSFGSQMNTQSVTSSGTQSIFGKPTISSSSLTGTATFTLNQPKTTNSSSFPVSTPGLFTSASPSTSPTAGSLFSASQLSNVRKRNFESEVNSNALFGKKDRSESTMEGPSSLGPFAVKQTAISSNVSSVPATFQPGEKSLFGKGISTSVESTEASKSLFGKPMSDSKTETLFKSQPVGRSLFSASDTTKESSSKQENVSTNESVFRKNIENSGTLKQTETGLFSGPAQRSLFGKEPSGGSNTGLFGKPSQTEFPKINRSASSYSLQQLNEKESLQDKESLHNNNRDPNEEQEVFNAGDDKAEGPLRRSLMKWKRTRDADMQEDLKKTGQSASEIDLRQAKRSRIPSEQGSRAPSRSISRTSLTRRSKEDLRSKTCIVIKEIPIHLNKGSVIRRHFSQFGNIVKLQPLTLKRSAYITYETHEEAKAAKENGIIMDEGSPPVTIFWRSSQPQKSPESQSSTEGMKPQRTLFSSNVAQELASMAGTSDYQEEMSGSASHYDEPRLSRREQAMQRATTSRVRSPTPPPASLQATAASIQATAVPDLESAKGLLKTIWRAKAKDTTERIAILDAKDKLLRMLRRRQQSDLATAKAFVGTCPDMCPEKERYYREDIRRLALYEVIPSTMTSVTGLKSKVDHSRAVKEYSRSSADQEEPLSHELRPLPVLVMTMNYLLAEVAGQGRDGQWSEWYDFLWNRTRGIRKDITQQQLCDVMVAELLEKCTRFHIFASERLCEEDMMSFDPKINNENLTKCLQTLKELYADLEKRQIFCPNEAEFRAYMVLMNLNEGDILREIQQLRPEIRESPYITFAIKAYNALNSNNYVRFFRLIKEAAFLNACALHRYFNQIRSKALLILMKALGAHGRIILYPVQEMINLLYFENVEEVREFCDHYCLAVEGYDVVMDSKANLEPESSLPQKRSQSLVEAKMTVSIGEVINGAPLPHIILSTPSSSFDQDGVFIMSHDFQEAIASSGLLKSSAVDQTSHNEEPCLRIVPEVRPENAPVSIEVIKSLARTIILEVIDANILDIATEVAAETGVVAAQLDEIVQSTVKEALSEIALNVFAEEEESLKKKLHEEMVQQRQRVFSALCDDIVEDTVSGMVKDVAASEMRVVNATLHKKSVELHSQAYRDDLVRNVVDEVLSHVAQEVYDLDVVAKRERLDATLKCVEAIRCRRILQRWKAKYVSCVKIKRSMLDFPSGPPPTKTTTEQLHSLMPDRPDNRISHKSFFVGESAKLSIESPMEIIQQQLHLSTRLSMASARKMLTNLLMWRPLDLTEIVGPQLQRSFQFWRSERIIESDTAILQWKLAVSVPDSAHSTIEKDYFVNWVKAKLCRNNDKENLLKQTPPYQGQVLTLQHKKLTSQRFSATSLGLCVRYFRGVWNDIQELDVLKKDVLKGTSALLFITSNTEDPLMKNSIKESIWQKDRKRLHQLVKQKRRDPAVPLIIIVPRVSQDEVSLEVLDEKLELNSLHQQNCLSAVHIAQPLVSSRERLLEHFDDWTVQLTNCLHFAANNFPPPPKLRVKPVSDYIEDAVVEFFKAPVYQDLRTRTKHQLLHQSPNTLLSLYNDVIEHTAMTAATGSLTDMSWPAPEFDDSSNKNIQSVWNTEGHLCDLNELIAKVRLPYFRYSDMEAESWSTVCEDVWSYIHNLTKKDSGSAKIKLFQQVVTLLSRVKKTFDQFCWLVMEDGPCEPTYMNMAWTDFIDACIHYRMVTLRTGHITIRRPEEEADETVDEGDEKEEEFEEVLVYYQEDELDDWEPPRVWEDALRDTETAEIGQIKPTVIQAAARGKNSVNVTTVHSSQHLSESNTVTVRKSDSTVVTDSGSSDWLAMKDKFEQERAAALKYEQTLKSLLLDGPPRPTTPSHDHLLATEVTPIYRDDDRVRPVRWVVPSTPLSRHSGAGAKTPQPTQVTPPQNLTARLNSPLFPQQGVIEDDILGPSLSERISDLKFKVQSEMQADVLFELKLRSLLDRPI